jgi:hypothetical protein
MKWWNEWTRKREGWVERKRRIQRTFNERIAAVTERRVPAVATVPVPVVPRTSPNRGEK